MEIQVKDNQEKNQFEGIVDSKMSKIEYSQSGNIIALTHTKVPEEQQGKGVGSALTEKVLQIIKEKNLKVDPQCGFVASYIEEHTKWKSILA